MKAFFYKKIFEKEYIIDPKINSIEDIEGRVVAGVLLNVEKICERELEVPLEQYDSIFSKEIDDYLYIEGFEVNSDGSYCYYFTDIIATQNSEIIKKELEFQINEYRKIGNINTILS